MLFGADGLRLGLLCFAVLLTIVLGLLGPLVLLGGADLAGADVGEITLLKNPLMVLLSTWLSSLLYVTFGLWRDVGFLIFCVISCGCGIRLRVLGWVFGLTAL